MKKLCTILAALTLAVLCAIILLPTEANAASTGDLTFSLNSDGKSYSVSDCNESASGSLTIPATYNGKPVTSIGDAAFQGCRNLTSITIPDSVTSIGAAAFSNCISLKSMTIPFVGNSGKTAQDTYQYPLGYIFGTSSYAGCVATLQPHYVSESSWRYYTYYIPASLKSVTITGGEIFRGAFYNCDNLTSITIPDGVTSIGDSAFDGCTGLTSITIPDGVTSIGGSAFDGCTGLTSITIPDSVTSIGYSAFDGCTGLKSVTIGNSVTSIGSYAFDSCTSLTSITIPDSVTSIGGSAFDGCTGLTNITIPDGVTSIGGAAFDGCTGLTNITIPDGVTSIGGSTFKGCTGLTSITIPDGVTSIGYSAFNGCTGLKSVTIGNSVTTIGSSAFYDCSSLTNITIPDSVTSIGDSAFNGCTGLTNITIPDSATSIGRGTFNRCTRLIYNIYDNGMYLGNAQNPHHILIEMISTDTTTCNIHKDTKVIGCHAFSGCTNLTDIAISDSVISIGGGAFAESSVKNVYITDIAAWCNISFENYEFVYLPPSDIYITVYGNPLYYGADLYLNGVLVTDLVLPNGVTRISNYAFYNYEKLSTIVIPNSVKSIGSNAFDGCSALAKVTYCGTATQWNKIGIGNYNTNLTSATRTYHTSHNWVGGDCVTRQTCSVCKAEGDYPHIWLDATCTSKKFCFLCGVTEGDYVHTWVAANCTTPKTCSECGVTEGDVQHSWRNATCTNPKTCAICKITEGTALGHNWTAANCTDPITCSRCGSTNDKPLGHMYDNERDYVCNTCGYSRLVTEPTLQFYSTPGLSFQDYIGMQLLAQNGVVKNYDKFYVIAVQETPDGLVETVLNGKLYYGAYQIFEQKIVSWSMSEKVTLTLYGEKNGIIYEGQTVSASVEELALTKLATYKAQNNAEACRALVDMLNYGATVQTFFGRNVANLPNDELGEFATLGSTGEPALAKTNAITGTAKVPVLKDNISMQAKVELQLLFSVDISAYTPKAMVNGKEVTVEIDNATYDCYGWTLVRVPVSAVNMRDTFTIALYDTDGNAVTQIYEVSVEGYANGRKNTDKHAIDVALLHYGDSVAAL